MCAHKWEFRTNHHATEPGFVPAPLLPERPHRPTGEPPRCRICGQTMSKTGGFCRDCQLLQLNGEIAFTWKNLIDYAYGEPPTAVTR